MDTQTRKPEDEKPDLFATRAQPNLQKWYFEPDLNPSGFQTP